MDRLEQIREFLNEQPDDSFLRYALAQEYAKRENWALAEESYQILLNTDPDYLATYYHLALLWRSQGKIEEAKELLDEGIDRAKAAREQHTLSEMQSLRLEIEYEDE
jgi:tetratricopeptide (TPR) repeat protein